jgi:hypothetical protein
MRALFTGAMCLRGARDLKPELLPHVEEVLQRVGMLEPVVEALADAETMAPDEWAQRCDRDLLGRPFADAGDEYAVRFAALGIRWTLRCANDYPHVRAVQRLAAALQITLVEMAAADLCLMPSDIDVHIAAVDGPPQEQPARVRSLPSNEGRLWEVELSDRTDPSSTIDPEEVLRELLGVITAVLMDVSLLPTAGYLSAIRNAFERGLLYSLAIGRPFDEVAAIVPAERFAASARRDIQPPLRDGTEGPVEHPELAWQAGPGPGFTEREAVEMAATRYARISALLPTTLERLRADTAFREIVARLRAEEWLDWHILTAVYNVAANHRLGEAGLNTYGAIVSREGQEAARRLTQTPALDEGPPIPVDIFDEDAIRQGRLMGIAPLVQNWRLQSRQRTPDYPAIERVLAERFGYWTIDAEHRDLFATVDAEHREPDGSSGETH